MADRKEVFQLSPSLKDRSLQWSSEHPSYPYGHKPKLQIVDCVIPSWENVQQTTMMGFVPLGKWDTAHLHQSGKQEEEILYGHQTYNFSAGL